MTYSVPGDGNCFFHAVLYEIKKIDKSRYDHYSHSILRRCAIEEIINNPSLYEGFLTIGDSINSYIDRMSTEGEYADNIIIQALARAMNLRIIIHRINAEGNINTNEITDDNNNVNASIELYYVSPAYHYIVSEEYLFAINNMLRKEFKNFFKQVYETITINKLLGEDGLCFDNHKAIVKCLSEKLLIKYSFQTKISSHDVMQTLADLIFRKIKISYHHNPKGETIIHEYSPELEKGEEVNLVYDKNFYQVDKYNAIEDKAEDLDNSFDSRYSPELTELFFGIKNNTIDFSQKENDKVNNHLDILNELTKSYTKNQDASLYYENPEIFTKESKCDVNDQIPEEYSCISTFFNILIGLITISFDHAAVHPS